MSLSDEFSRQVVMSHGVVVITIQSGEQPDLGTFIELGAELLAIHKLASLQSQEVNTIKETRELWQKAHECFCASETLWHQLPSGGELPELHATEVPPPFGPRRFGDSRRHFIGSGLVVHPPRSSRMAERSRVIKSLLKNYVVLPPKVRIKKTRTDWRFRAKGKKQAVQTRMMVLGHPYGFRTQDCIQPRQSCHLDFGVRNDMRECAWALGVSA
jgi:hypothetical protein